MKFLSNISYDNIDEGIEYLKRNKLNFYPDNNPIIFHVYWYGNIGRKQILCINSYLATQNLQQTKLWVWLDYKTYNNNKSKIPRHHNIEIKKYEPNLESKGTLFEQLKYINNERYLKFRSDLARIIFLYKYGGLYYDLDMILIKDLMPLLGIEFCYTWSYKKTGNNGILRLRQKSDTCLQIMKQYTKILQNTRFYIGLNQEIFTEQITDLLCLPCVLFDPVWILHDYKQISKYSKLNNLDNFFKTTNENIDKDINKFFGNEIYAYHWHSRSNYTIEKNSYFERLETFILSKLNKIK